MLQEEDFEHLSPAPFEHINHLGKYNFKAAAAMDEIKLEENVLRALGKLKIKSQTSIFLLIVARTLNKIFLHLTRLVNYSNKTSFWFAD